MQNRKRVRHEPKPRPQWQIDFEQQYETFREYQYVCKISGEKLGNGVTSNVFMGTIIHPENPPLVALEWPPNLVVAVKNFVRSPHKSMSNHLWYARCEIEYWKRCNGHPNIIQLYEIAKSKSLNFYYLMEIAECDLQRVLLSPAIQQVSPALVKAWMHDILSGVEWMAEKGVIHRDIKPANLFFGTDRRIKLGDFGFATADRLFEDPETPAPTTTTTTPLSHHVQTHWYRAPEVSVLMNMRADEKTIDFIPYGLPIDLWSVGCVFAELMTNGRPLFNAESDKSQLELIWVIRGTPTLSDWHPSQQPYLQLPRGITVDPDLFEKRFQIRSRDVWNPSLATTYALNLLRRLLEPVPHRRITAAEALKHSYFTEEKPEMRPLHLRQSYRVFTQNTYF